MSQDHNLGALTEANKVLGVMIIRVQSNREDLITQEIPRNREKNSPLFK